MTIQDLQKQPRLSAVHPLSQQQKAAVIVGLLLSEGASVPLNRLPVPMQEALAHQIGQMRPVNRGTLDAVVDEFIDQLSDIGLSFPDGLEATLSVLDGKISEDIAGELRKQTGMPAVHDPWETIAGQPAERILPILEAESIEVGAVILAKLNVAKAAEVLSRLPGERARRLTYAVSRTDAVSPATVHRIGVALARELSIVPEIAFNDGPVERVGAILNFSPSATRDDVLAGLDEADKGFADEVRKAIFTFAHIPTRIEPRDVPKVLRAVDPALLSTALAAATDALAPTAEFILENMSKRMAEQLREEIAEKGDVKLADGETAMNAVVAAIRELESNGELFLIALEEEEV